MAENIIFKNDIQYSQTLARWQKNITSKIIIYVAIFLYILLRAEKTSRTNGKLYMKINIEALSQWEASFFFQSNQKRHGFANLVAKFVFSIKELSNEEPFFRPKKHVRKIFETCNIVYLMYLWKISRAN